MTRSGATVMAMMLGGAVLLGRQTATRTGPVADTSVIDAQGTAHVTRVVPLPQNLSPEAQKSVGRIVSDEARPQSLADRRSSTDTWQARAGQAMQAVYPVTIADSQIAGVPVRIVTPPDTPAARQDRVLICVHGGGFNSDSGSLTESIPVANLAHTKVISVLYRLAPEHPFPAGMNDVIAVYRSLLETYAPDHIGIFGTSAGAILTPEVAVRLKQLGVPLPGALGVFSGMGDFSRNGDSQSIYALNGLSGHLDPPDGTVHDAEYVGNTDPKDPVLSPIFADAHGFPPTLFVTSTRDMLLSGTTTLQRHFYEAGVESPMVIFEGLPHAFWNDVSLPESREAHRVMAAFFDAHLGK